MSVMKYHGARFSAIIRGEKTTGRIAIHRINGRYAVLLCQNRISGFDLDEKFGYDYSWFVFYTPRVGFLREVDFYNKTYTGVRVKDIKLYGTNLEKICNGIT